MILHLVKFIFSKKYRKQCVISDVMCSCGKYEKCIRKIKVKDGGLFGIGTLYVDTKDHFRCGKVQERIKQMKKSFNNHREHKAKVLTKEEVEKGRSNAYKYLDIKQ